MEGWEIKKLRKFLGWSQEKFAQRVGVSYPTLNRWEKGHFKPSKMAEAMLERFLKDIREKKGIRVGHRLPRDGMLREDTFQIKKEPKK